MEKNLHWCFRCEGGEGVFQNSKYPVVITHLIACQKDGRESRTIGDLDENSETKTLDAFCVTSSRRVSGQTFLSLLWKVSRPSLGHGLFKWDVLILQPRKVAGPVSSRTVFQNLFTSPSSPFSILNFSCRTKYCYHSQLRQYCFQMQRASYFWTFRITEHYEHFIKIISLRNDQNFTATSSYIPIIILYLLNLKKYQYS